MFSKSDPFLIIKRAVPDGSYVDLVKTEVCAFCVRVRLCVFVCTCACALVRLCACARVRIGVSVGVGVCACVVRACVRACVQRKRKSM